MTQATPNSYLDTSNLTTYTAPIDPLREAVEALARQQAEWEEGTIKGLLKPWQAWLLVHTKSRLLVRLIGIERRHSYDYSALTKTIEIWQRGQVKARSTWRINPTQTHA